MNFVAPQEPMNQHCVFEFIIYFATCDPILTTLHANTSVFKLESASIPYYRVGLLLDSTLVRPNLITSIMKTLLFTKTKVNFKHIILPNMFQYNSSLPYSDYVAICLDYKVS